MGSAYVLILVFLAGNNPPTASLAQEFSSQQACQTAGEQATQLVQNLPHVQARYICAAKG